MVSASACVGLTFPGMMLLPGSFSGSSSSPSPQLSVGVEWVLRGWVGGCGSGGGVGVGVCGRGCVGLGGGVFGGRCVRRRGFWGSVMTAARALCLFWSLKTFFGRALNARARRHTARTPHRRARERTHTRRRARNANATRNNATATHRGPLPSRRTSLAILNRLAASVLSAPLISTRLSCAASASNLFGAVTNGRPVSAATFCGVGCLCWCVACGKRRRLLSASLPKTQSTQHRNPPTAHAHTHNTHTPTPHTHPPARRPWRRSRPWC